MKSEAVALEQAIGQAADAMKKFDDEKKKAMDGAEANRFKEIVDDVRGSLDKANLVFENGVVIEKAARDADKKVERLKKDREAVLKELEAALNDPSKDEKVREELRGNLARADSAVLVAEEEKKRATATRQSNDEDERRIRIANSPQAQRARRQAEEDAKKRIPGFDVNNPAHVAAVKQAGDNSDKLRAAGWADQNAATSREVQYQIDLANAYLQSTAAARELMAEQKAAEARVTGSGNPNARDARNLEFFKGLVDLNAETRKTLEELPDTEAKIKASMSSAGAFGYTAIEGVLAKIRDLRSKAFGDASPEGQAQQAKLTQAEAEAKDAARKKAAANLGQQQADFIARTKDEIAITRVKMTVAGQSQLVEEKAVANAQADFDIRKANNLLASDEIALKERLAQIEERRKYALQLADVNEAARRANGPLAAYQREAAEGWRAYEQGVVSAFNATDDALTGILMQTKTWQSAMSDLLKSVAADFAKIIIRQNITAPLAEAIFGGAGPGLISRGFNWISGLFAGGGIMTSRGPLPLRGYAGGGVASSPQLALFGEGSTPEAYVPVPNGRIPVTLKGGGGGNVISTSINVNVAGGGGGGGRGGSGSGDPAAMGREIAAAVTAEFNRNLRENMRPGGILNPAGSFNPGYAT
jgi:hypothetical protein